MKMWSQFEPTPAHLSYIILPLFLVIYALFSLFIRNVLHLSEPPLAMLYGIILGPHALGFIQPRSWGLSDRTTQEVTRIIIGIQCFAVGIELPKFYFTRHWKSVLYFLGPVMTFSWVISSAFAYFIFKTSIPAALVIGACLSPTDPVLAASVLGESRFSKRVPNRLKDLLSAESACNDGVSFPFLYVGLVSLKYLDNPSEAVKEWFLITLIYQCMVGLLLGLIIGRCANVGLKFSESKGYVSESSFIVFYLLLAILSVGIASVLGVDDFLVAFGAGVGFAHDGWFSKKTASVSFPQTIDLLLNSSLFVMFGAIIDWDQFTPSDITPHCGIWQLLLFLALILLFRRIPIVYALKSLIPDLRTHREALFCGHFGAMGAGAIFLAMESRAQLETGTSLPLGKPKVPTPPYTEREKALWLVWPAVCFVVVGSTMVHGLSVAAISIGGHFMRPKGERAPLLGGEDDALDAMDHDGGGGDSEPEINGTDDEVEG